MVRNRLDEMQEQKLLRIEGKGYWIAFWGLLLIIFIQQLVYGLGDVRTIAGEWIMLMSLALYMIIRCLRNGIWDRRLEPDRRTNLKVSFIGSAVFGLFMAGVNYFNYGDLFTAAVVLLLLGIVVFILIFGGLSLAVHIYQKRLEKLENTVGEE